jgi:hypothetical protein
MKIVVFGNLGSFADVLPDFPRAELETLALLC